MHRGALVQLLLGIVKLGLALGKLTLQISYELLGIGDRAVGGPRED